MVVIIAILLTYLNYTNSKQSLYLLLEKFTGLASKNIIERSYNYLNKTNNYMKILAHSNKEDNVYIREKENIQSMISFMQLQKHVSSVYIADVHGGFLQVKRDPDIKVIDKKIDFDPRTREWFKLSNEIVQVTKAYNFFADKKFGITTYYANFDDKGNKIAVVGVDILYDTFIKFIKDEASAINSDIALVNKSDNLFILSSNNNLNQKYIYKSIDTIKENQALVLAINKFILGNENSSVIDTNGVKYLYGGKTIKIDSIDMSAVICIKENIVLGKLKKDLLNTLYISLFILFLFIIIAIRISILIARPISKLTNEIYELKQLKTSVDIQNDSTISEIHLAQSSLQQLKSGMESFKKYMPLELVSKLIESNTAAKIGGEEKPLVVMFTDIQDFTGISENMTPTELTKQLSEYFTHMQEIIWKYEGTIDKYIGDSIMIFWGAPLEVDEPVLKAVKCAMEMQRKLDAINEVWKKEGKSELQTRIGIHYGLTLVGNIGSNERMNYTIMGDSVNTAARLENINKVYTTKIIFSQEVNELVEDKLITKYVDEVTLKGQSKRTKIYTVIDF